MVQVFSPSQSMSEIANKCICVYVLNEDFDTCVYDKKMIRMLLAMQLPHTQKKTPEAGFIYIFIVIRQILEYF